MCNPHGQKRKGPDKSKLDRDRKDLIMGIARHKSGHAGLSGC